MNDATERNGRQKICLRSARGASVEPCDYLCQVFRPPIAVSLILDGQVLGRVVLRRQFFCHLATYGRVIHATLQDPDAGHLVIVVVEQVSETAHEKLDKI